MSDDGIDVVMRGGSWRLVQLREGAADATQRRCKDCHHMVGHVTWWCHSKPAREAHKTNIPGFADCEFWQAPPVREPFMVKLRKHSWWRFWARKEG